MSDLISFDEKIVKTIKELDVFDSGVIHTVENREFIFKFKGDKFSFFLKSDSGQARYEVNVLNESESNIFIYNHNNPLGTAVVDPIHIAEYKNDNKNLYFTYYVNSLNSRDSSSVGYRFEYVFYIGKHS
jgi:hypothetical protein